MENATHFQYRWRILPIQAENQGGI
jgi:hypothetical protein